MNQTQETNELALAINSIELDELDLLKISLDSINTFSKFYPQYENFVDNLLKDNNFVQQANQVTRNSMILGVQSLIIEKNFDFKLLFPLCFTKENLISYIDDYSDNEQTKYFFNILFKYIAVEAYTATVSRNKEIIQLSEMDKNFIDQRTEEFKSYVHI